MHVCRALVAGLLCLSVLGSSPGPAGALATEDRVVFARRGGPSTTFDLWTVPAAGGQPTRLTHDDKRDETHPSASPDGRHLVYVSTAAGEGNGPNPSNSDLVVLDLASGRTRPLVAEPGVAEYRPAWSPDGKLIAYSREAPAGSGVSVDIYVVPADGSRPPSVLVPGASQDNFPTWSPDGRHLAHTCQFQICEQELGGGRRHVHLSATTFLSGAPAWGPYLAFHASDGEDLDLWRVPPPGPGRGVNAESISTDIRRERLIDTDDIHERLPAWSPDHRSLVYGRFEVAPCGAHRVGLAACPSELWTATNLGSQPEKVLMRPLTRGAFDTYPAFIPRVGGVRPRP
jgi:Tol biopolymer transport system component